MLCRNSVNAASQRRASGKLARKRFQRTLAIGKRKEGSISKLQETLDRVVKK